MKSNKIGAAIIGCGNIAGTYARQIQNYKQVEILGFFDTLQDRATKLASEYGGKVYASLEEALADPAVELIINLTIHHAHAAVIRQCLEAGKHVHTEKPLALSYRDAAALCDLAEKKGLRLSSAPSNFMGAAQEAAWKLLRDGRAGTPRLVYAEVNHGRIEKWHPNPEPFYDVGILWDVSVYPLTLLTTFFGPARRVNGLRRFIQRDRLTMEGRPFHLNVPDFALALIEFDSGVVARLTANFYVEGSHQNGSLEIHGDAGRIFLGNFQVFNAKVEVGEYGKPYEPVEIARPTDGAEFARGVDELTVSMLADRPQRSTGRQAAHVCEIIEAIGLSADEGRPVDVTSTFVAPKPVDFSELAPPAK